MQICPQTKFAFTQFSEVINKDMGFLEVRKIKS